jgi:hypothetical protein
MRIRQAVPPQLRRMSPSSTSQYAAPTELMQILETASYKDSAPAELQTSFVSIRVHSRLISGRSEFQNLAGSIPAPTTIGPASAADAPSET